MTDVDTGRDLDTPDEWERCALFDDGLAAFEAGGSWRWCPHENDWSRRGPWFLGWWAGARRSGRWAGLIRIEAGPLLAVELKRARARAVRARLDAARRDRSDPPTPAYGTPPDRTARRPRSQAWASARWRE